MANNRPIRSKNRVGRRTSEKSEKSETSSDQIFASANEEPSLLDGSTGHGYKAKPFFDLSRSCGCSHLLVLVV